MENIQIASSGVVILVAVFLAVTILRKPIGCAIKILLNILLGFVILFAVNFLGAYIGLSLGINWINAIIVAVLGLPGVILLIVLQFLM